MHVLDPNIYNIHDAAITFLQIFPGGMTTDNWPADGISRRQLEGIMQTGHIGLQLSTGWAWMEGCIPDSDWMTLEAYYYYGPSAYYHVTTRDVMRQFAIDNADALKAQRNNG